MRLYSKFASVLTHQYSKFFSLIFVSQFSDMKIWDIRRRERVRFALDSFLVGLSIMVIINRLLVAIGCRRCFSCELWSGWRWFLLQCWTQPYLELRGGGRKIKDTYSSPVSLALTFTEANSPQFLPRHGHELMKGKRTDPPHLMLLRTVHQQNWVS